VTHSGSAAHLANIPSEVAPYYANAKQIERGACLRQNIPMVERYRSGGGTTSAMRYINSRDLEDISWLTRP
jgi:hypothetical protein